MPLLISLPLLVLFWQSVLEPCSKAELMSFLVGETFLDGFCHADLLFWPLTCLASTAPQSQCFNCPLVTEIITYRWKIGSGHKY